MNLTEIELVINKEINAPLARVYDAWTDATILAQWFGAQGMPVQDTRIDDVVGGNYMIHLRDPETGNDRIVSGTYEQVIPNEKLIFNWMWNDGVDRSQVTIDFEQLSPDRTLLTLTHRGFSQQEYRDKHHHGWNACVEGLASYFTQTQP